MWRSFGLITMDDAKKGQRRPGIIDWLNSDSIQEQISKKKISVWAISMLAGGSSSSQIPVDEIVDVLNLNEMMVTDQSEEGWCVRINEAVVTTKAVVEKAYKNYIRDVAQIRNIGKIEKEKPNVKKKSKAKGNVSIDKQTEDLYAVIDRPFREWLEAIRPEDDKDAQIKLWKESLKRLVSRQARQIFEEANHRDFVGIMDDKGHIKNIATAYNWFCARLNRQFSN